MAKRILVIHGPNLNLLGKREPDIYGKFSLDKINKSLLDKAKKVKAQLKIVQSNHEGEIVDLLGKSRGKFDVIIINPAAYTHTSVAIRDAVVACGIPAIEVHLSNIYSREIFRQNSLIAPVCKGQVSGFGALSYILALEAALDICKNK
jgi:3-dehydroquinate dehydratase-2